MFGLVLSSQKPERRRSDEITGDQIRVFLGHPNLLQIRNSPEIVSQADLYVSFGRRVSIFQINETTMS